MLKERYNIGNAVGKLLNYIQLCLLSLNPTQLKHSPTNLPFNISYEVLDKGQRVTEIKITFIDYSKEL